MKNRLTRARQWARTLKSEVVALWLAARDPRTPMLAKVVAASVAAYALSPIDLIPDFIPVLGYLDDLLIVPFGIMLAIRLIPANLMAEFRILAAEKQDRITSRSGLAAILAIWATAMVVTAYVVWTHLNPV